MIREFVEVTGALQVKLAREEMPETLGPHELLIETEYSFISAGTELSIYTGDEPRTRVPGSWCYYPFRSGYANVGYVLMVGQEVDSVQIGQRVFTYGPHASHFRYDLSRPNNMVGVVPDNVPSDLAAAARMAQVALTAIDVSASSSNPGYGRRVAVFGLGMVGNLASQLFHIVGCEVLGIDPSPRRRQLAQQCGIAHVADSETAEEAVRDWTNGQGVEVAIDAVGHSRVVQQCIKVAAPHGEVILLGSPRVPVEGELTETFSRVHHQWITLKGALEWRLPVRGRLPHEHSQERQFKALMSWLQNSKLNLSPLISHHLPPSQIKQAYDGLLHQKDEYTGVVLDWRDGSTS